MTWAVRGQEKLDIADERAGLSVQGGHPEWQLSLLGEPDGLGLHDFVIEFQKIIPVHLVKSWWRSIMQRWVVFVDAGGILQQGA
jgi:hypothetical protein